ncbi:MAG: hypothetical protein KJ698_06840 [Actinobacteria bacterium]|nr:hypothetical protein [Actinomycetota bacterium]
MGTRNGIGITAVGVAVLLASLVPAAAGTPQLGDAFAGTRFRITDLAVVSGVEVPVVAYNSRNNQYLVVWSDQRNSATRQNDIYGQLMKGDGTLIGVNFRISGPGATGPEYPTAVAYNSVSNQYLVVWQYERDGGYDIYGRRVKANGKVAGKEFRINGDVASDPAVAHNPVTNQYLVVWRAGAIYGQRINATGALVGGAFRISGDAVAGNQFSPEVVCNTATGYYFVVWKDSRNGPTPWAYDVFGRRIKKSGIPAGSDFMVNEDDSGVANGERPAVAYNSIRNQYMVLWEDLRNYTTTMHDIYGRRVKARGRPLGGDVRVSGNPTPQEYEHQPVLAYDPAADRYLVAWEVLGYGDRGIELYARRVRGSGQPMGADKRVAGTRDDDKEPSVAYNSAAHEFLVVWSATGSTVIYGRRVNG